MESRLFSPIEKPISKDPQANLLELSIRNINEIIEFANHYRFRPSDYGQLYANMPETSASLSTDIEKREKIAKELTNPVYISSLRKKLDKHNLDKAISEFLKHKQFLHFTAGELAAIAVTLDNLILIVSELIKEFKDNEIKAIFYAKLQEFLQTRDEICQCMNYHLKNLEINLAIKDESENFYFSDLLLTFNQRIKKTIGANMHENIHELWPDISIYLSIPLLPFYHDTVHTDVKNFFEMYVKHDMLKILEDLAEEENKPTAPTGGVTQTAESMMSKAFNLTGWMLKGVGSAAYQVAVSPVTIASGTMRLTSWMIYGQKAATPIDAATQESSVPAAKPTTSVSGSNVDADAQQLSDPEDHWAELKIVTKTTISTESANEEENEKKLVHAMGQMRDVLEKAKTVSDQSMEDFRVLEASRKKIMLLKSELDKEVKRMKPIEHSCFAFFVAKTLRVKRQKIEALSHLLTATSMIDLQDKAKTEKDNDPFYRAALFGRHSRTRKVVNAIIDTKINVNKRIR